MTDVLPGNVPDHKDHEEAHEQHDEDDHNPDGPVKAYQARCPSHAQRTGEVE